MAKKHFIKIIIIVLLVIIIPLGVCYGIQFFSWDNAGYYKEIWGVEMPYLKEAYSVDNIGWFGEGTEYAVYQLREEPMELDSYLKEEKDSSFEQAVNALAAALQVPGEKLPDWGTGYQWDRLEVSAEGPSGSGFKDDILYIIYVPSAMQLILVRDIF